MTKLTCIAFLIGFTFMPPFQLAAGEKYHEWLARIERPTFTFVSGASIDERHYALYLSKEGEIGFFLSDDDYPTSIGNVDFEDTNGNRLRRERVEVFYRTINVDPAGTTKTKVVDGAAYVIRGQVPNVVVLKYRLPTSGEEDTVTEYFEGRIRLRESSK